jgi:glutathione synthase/RimK-type ligase-like ATP-grasp enzyme
MTGAIHVIHENPEWAAPLFRALEARGLPYADWCVIDGSVDLSEVPPAGIFYSRMSASAHTRGHRFSPEYAAGLLTWLEAQGARVVNGSQVLALELSKVAQYAALSHQGIRVPRTVPALGREAVLRAAERFDGPFIGKHNRAGKGLGVRLFQSTAALRAHLDGPEYEAPVDGITLLQAYIQAPEPYITRVEFVGGKLLYAVRVDTSDGFELCPAEACAVPGAARPRFEIIEGFESPLLPAYERFLAANGIEVAGIEFIVDAEGTPYTYDVNTNTNYNPEAEAVAGVSGMATLTEFLGRLLAEQAGRPASPQAATG